jgi:hypothetical protein
MTDRDDLAELIAPDTIALERSLGARAERGEQARAGADRILAAGWVKATAATERVLDELATELRDRGTRRDAADGDREQECDGETCPADCHTVAAVTTWQRAASLIERRSAALRALHPGEDT